MNEDRKRVSLDKEVEQLMIKPKHWNSYKNTLLLYTRIVMTCITSNTSTVSVLHGLFNQLKITVFGKQEKMFCC